MVRIQEILRQSDCLANISIDQILFESSYPILFSGYDNSNVYLFICHSVNSERMAWIVTKTTYDIIISMLNNKMTIRDAFLGFTSKKILLTFDKEGMHTSICDVKEIDDNILPTSGQYMDAEEGEFDEEIQYYESMKAKMEKTITYSFCINGLDYSSQFDHTFSLTSSHSDSIGWKIIEAVKMFVHDFRLQQFINNDSILVDCGRNQNTKNVKACPKEIKYECQCL